MKFGNSIGIFLNSANLICRSTNISKFSDGPFDFEITRVNCILYQQSQANSQQNGKSDFAHAPFDLLQMALIGASHAQSRLSAATILLRLLSQDHTTRKVIFSHSVISLNQLLKEKSKKHC